MPPPINIEILDLLGAHAFAGVMQSGSIALERSAIDIIKIARSVAVNYGPQFAENIDSCSSSLKTQIEGLLRKGIFEQGEQGLKSAMQKSYNLIFTLVVVPVSERVKDMSTEVLRANVTQKLIGCIVDVLSVKEENIELNHSFITALGADSLDVVELIMCIEDRFRIELSDDEAESIYTVQDAVDMVLSKLTSLPD